MSKAKEGIKIRVLHPRKQKSIKAKMRVVNVIIPVTMSFLG